MTPVQFQETARGRFAYRATAPGGPDRPTVVLLHGWPESSACWEAVVERLTGFRCIRPDLRGMGDSERTPDPAAYVKQALAQDVLTLLDALGVGWFMLVGHDWGGIVAQEMALAAPDRIDRLALLAISIIPNAVGNAQAADRLRASGGRSLWYQTFLQLPHLAEALLPGNETVWLRTFLRTASGRPYPDDVFADVLRTFQLPGTALTTANLYRTMSADRQRWASLAGTSFAMPGLYVHGLLDPVIVPEYAVGAEACFPRLDVLALPKAGHFVLADEPEAVADALHRFFTEPSVPVYNRAQN